MENLEKQMPEGTAYIINVKKDDKTYTVYLREADKKVISTAFSQMRNVKKENFDMIAIGEMILRSCFLGGDVEILNDAKLLISASLQCYELIEIYDAEIKKI